MCTAKKPLEDKKFYFQFLTSLFTAGWMATGLCDSVSLRISTKRCTTMVKMFSMTKHYSNWVQTGLLADIFILCNVQSASREVLGFMLQDSGRWEASSIKWSWSNYDRRLWQTHTVKHFHLTLKSVSDAILLLYLKCFIWNVSCLLTNSNIW